MVSPGFLTSLILQVYYKELLDVFYLLCVPISASSSVGSVASGLAELSLTSLTTGESLTTSESSSSDRSTSSETCTTDRAQRRTQCKSCESLTCVSNFLLVCVCVHVCHCLLSTVIRPPISQLYTRRLKKHDPVSRYV